MGKTRVIPELIESVGRSDLVVMGSLLVLVADSEALGPSCPGGANVDDRVVVPPELAPVALFESDVQSAVSEPSTEVVLSPFPSFPSPVSCP